MHDNKSNETISNEKQTQLLKNFACLSSFKTKMQSYPQQSSFTKHCQNENNNANNANIFNTNLSFCSIDLNHTGNIPNKTNGSFRLHLGNTKDTITSFYSRDFETNINDGLFFLQSNPFAANPLYAASVEEEINQEPLDGKSQGIEEGSESTKKQTAIDVEDSADIDEEMKENSKAEMACVHSACEASFRTLKQKLAHHHKMSPECKKDTIHLLTAIRKVKMLIKTLNKKRNIKGCKDIKELYEKTMKSIAMTEHVQMTTGMKFDDNI